MLGAKTKYKNIKIVDIIFFLILMLEDAGMFGILPLGIAQILLLLMGGILVAQEMYEHTDIILPKKLLVMLFYMFLITLFFPYDSESITNIGLFVIEIVVLYLYVKRMKEKSTLLNIIYNAAFWLSCIGIIQEIGYVLGISMLCDMRQYGFPRECVYEIVGRPLARVSSLYSEPASLIGVMSAAFLISLFCGKREGVKLYKTVIIFLFAVLTQSTILYVAYVIVLAIYLLFFKQPSAKKTRWFVVLICGAMALVIIMPEMIMAIFMKLTTLHNTSSTSTSDLSAFALVSNLQIAIEKLKDGYILGTGYNSHRLYYEQYLSALYDEVLVKLNYSDAGSMYIRCISEFGFIGVVFLVGGLIFYFMRAFLRRNNFKLFCVTVLMVALLRDGNYIRTLSALLFVIIFFIKDSRNKEHFFVDEGMDK